MDLIQSLEVKQAWITRVWLTAHQAGRKDICDRYDEAAKRLALKKLSLMGINTHPVGWRSV